MEYPLGAESVEFSVSKHMKKCFETHNLAFYQ